MEENLTSGVDATISEPAAAGQTDATVDQNTTASGTTEATPKETGVKAEGNTAENPAAGDNTTDDKVEKAFAKRLAAEREKITQESAQKARDALIAEQGYEWNGKPITTEAEYKQALREKEIYDSLQNQDLPEEVIQELVENRRFREQFAQMQQQTQLQQKLEADIKEFQSAYPDVKDEELTPEVFELCKNRGLSLLDAYNRVSMPQRIAKLEEALGVKQKNAENATTSPGSVTGNGSANDGFISAETFEQNRGDQSWVNKNFNKIIESRKKW